MSSAFLKSEKNKTQFWSEPHYYDHETNASDWTQNGFCASLPECISYQAQWGYFFKKFAFDSNSTSIPNPNSPDFFKRFQKVPKAKTKLHELNQAVGYPNETQSFFQMRDHSVIVISKKDYYCFMVLFWVSALQQW